MRIRRSHGDFAKHVFQAGKIWKIPLLLSDPLPDLGNLQFLGKSGSHEMGDTLTLYDIWAGTLS